VAAAPAPFETQRELERVVEKQSAGFGVRADAPKTTLRIGSGDEFRFNVSSDRDGFLYVLGHGSDGTLAQLVPNQRSGPTVRVRKGQPWRFPAGDRFTLYASEPIGPTQILVIVSARERSFDALRPESADLVRLFPARDQLAGLVAAQSGPGAALAGAPRCPAGAPCEDEYGAALLRFDTVR
jgi:hypothetical protein